jgi:nitrogen regulatory protein P-II 2
MVQSSTAGGTILVRQKCSLVQKSARGRHRRPGRCPFKATGHGTDSALLNRALIRGIEAYRTVFSNVALRPVLCEMHIMKMITAVVRPFKLDELRHAIAQLGVQGVTITEVYEAEHGPRAKVEIAVDDLIVEPVLEAIANVSRTGRVGDGKIIVGNLEQAIRIRTGETGTAAT